MVSVIWWRSKAFWLKTQLFLSFQIFQTLASHNNVMKEWVNQGNPAMWLNWWKWPWTLSVATKEIPNHCKTNSHTCPNIAQLKNKWHAVSSALQPLIHLSSSCWSTRRDTRLSFVGSLLRRSLQANGDTFSGTYLCQTSSNIPLERGSSTVMRKW